VEASGNHADQNHIFTNKKFIIPIYLIPCMQNAKKNVFISKFIKNLNKNSKMCVCDKLSEATKMLINSKPT
jgi:hypothetical protein